MSLESVRAAYQARSTEYTDAVGRIDHVAAEDLDLVASWARGLNGLVLDVGCGPGQWTHFLTRLGVSAAGIDPVPEFVESARATYPGSSYRLGRAEDLGVAKGSLGGVLAWYSLIHTEPERIGGALDEIARCLRPGGGLAVGFFAGPKLRPFDHAVVTAYCWPIESMVATIEAAGFDVAHTESRTDRPARTHAAILAIRRRAA